MTLALGRQAPSFSLADTGGVTHSPGGGPATLVVFTCNHCPYALAWHDRIAAVARDYPDVKVLAINPTTRSATRATPTTRRLIAARVAEPLVLGGVDRVGLFERISRASCSQSRLACCEAFAWIFVPSIAINPTLTNPASAQSASTSPNRPATAVS
jgi:hypothetical protein